MYSFQRKAVMMSNDSSMAYRARKAGESLKARKKLEQKYDEDDKLGIPGNIVEWINQTLDGDHPKFENVAGPSGEGVSWRKFQFHIRDGVVNCKLLNKLLTADEKDHIKFNAANTSTAFVALENIDNFTKAAATYGVPKDSMFTSSDLYEGLKGPFVGVVQCLHQLGIIANSKGFEPKYKVVEIIKQDGIEET